MYPTATHRQITLSLVEMSGRAEKAVAVERGAVGGFFSLTAAYTAAVQEDICELMHHHAFSQHVQPQDSLFMKL